MCLIRSLLGLLLQSPPPGAVVPVLAPAAGDGDAVARLDQALIAGGVVRPPGGTILLRKAHASLGSAGGLYAGVEVRVLVAARALVVAGGAGGRHAAADEDGEGGQAANDDCCEVSQ